MIFHENRLLADNSHALYFSKIRKDVAKFVVCCSLDWCFKGLKNSRPVVKSAYLKNNFLISQPKHILWVLKKKSQ